MFSIVFHAKRPVHCHRNVSNGVPYLLCKSNKILMVRIHIGKLDINKQDKLVLGLLLPFSDASVDNAFSLFSKLRKTCHLFTDIKQQIYTFASEIYCINNVLNKRKHKQQYIHDGCKALNYTYTHLMASFPGQPGKPVPKRLNQSGF